VSYRIQHLADAKVVKHPFGVAREMFGGLDDDFGVARISMTDDHEHYHGNTTEVYYVLAGEGNILLDGEPHEIGPDTAILISPGTKHRATAKEGQVLDLLVFSIPAYDLGDEFRTGE